MTVDAPIDSFQGQHRWLSNFWPSAVALDGLWYGSVENAYQAAKVPPSHRGSFRHDCSPGQAKRLGGSFPLPADWEQRKVGVMRALLRDKFSSGSLLAARLLATGDAPLIEGNTWGDRFWGVCYGVGQNHLGRLLMERRAELQEVNHG